MPIILAFMHFSCFIALFVYIYIYNLTDATEKLYLIANRYWLSRLEEMPEMATREGINKFDNNLEEFSMAAFTRRRVSYVRGK